MFTCHYVYNIQMIFISKQDKCFLWWHNLMEIHCTNFSFTCIFILYIYLLYVYIIYFILHVFRIFKSVTKPPPFKDDSIMDKDFDISYPCYILSETYFMNHLSSCSYHFRYQIFVLWRETNVGQLRHFFSPSWGGRYDFHKHTHLINIDFPF